MIYLVKDMMPIFPILQKETLWPNFGRSYPKPEMGQKPKTSKEIY